MRVMENANQLQSSVRRLLKSIYEEQKLKSKQIECVRRHIAYIFLLVFTVNATMLSSKHYSLLSCGTLRSLEEKPSSQLPNAFTNRYWVNLFSFTVATFALTTNHKWNWNNDGDR